MQDWTHGARRRALLITFGVCATTPLTLVAQNVAAQAQIVDQAGSLRMLSQRIVKAYCQLGLGVLPNDAETILARSVTRFNGAFVSVRENSASDPALIKRIEADWSQFRDLVTLAPSKNAIEKLDALSESILQSAEALTGQLATRLGRTAATWTNISGRQRMLSQRMAKSGFEMMWGMDTKVYGQRFDEAHEQFKVALTELKRVNHNSIDIARNLELAEIQFGLFDVALGNRRELSKLSPARAANVARTSERLLEIFDETTRQFASIKLS
jgi:Type IV pili methyl-accepting chemotaxis transducer N-term